MNNIEILEEFIKNYKEVQEKYKDDEIQAEIERSCYFEEVPAEAIENLIKENKELREYKKIAELTKISCCTAQNCEALNNAIREGLENDKLRIRIEELEKQIPSPDNYVPIEDQTNIFVNKRDYISKETVKEKIKELIKEADYKTADNPAGRVHFHKEPCDYQLEILKELLEEGE